ncbi:MAG: multiheme c-type cytochrome, partial [Planctomycetota bacterium]|nr:multiheme c-type cytochrome [Planctomycetota bacterium]
MSMHFSISFPYLLVLLLLGAGTVLAIRYARSRSRSAAVSRSVVAVWCLILLSTALVSWSFNQADPRPRPDDRPVEVHADGFVSSQNCRSCHQRQYETWQASYHRTMTQVATPETVIGEFDGRFLERDGHTFGVRREGDTFMVTLLDDVGRVVNRPVVMTTGFHHMQVYWFSTGNGRMLGHFPFVYLRDEKRWISSDASFLHPESKGLTHSQLTNVGLWNHTCLKCHVTNPRSGIQDLHDGRGVVMDTHMAEFGIACEACHGPGEDHVAANQNPIHRYAQRFDDGTDNTITNPRRLDHRKASQVCGICHGITTMGGAEEEVLWREQG